MKKRIIRTGLLIMLLILLIVSNRDQNKPAFGAGKEHPGEAAALRQSEADTQTEPGIGETEYDAAAGMEETGYGAAAGMEGTESDAAGAKAGAPDAASRIADAIRRILASGTREFFCGYPVDESFLCWIGGTYGQELLLCLADKAGEEQDAGMWYELTGSSVHVLWTDYCRAHGFASYEWDNVEWKKVGDPSCIRLDFIGDIGSDSGWQAPGAASDGGRGRITQNLKDELQSADLVVAGPEVCDSGCEVSFENQAYEIRSFILGGRKVSVVSASKTGQFSEEAGRTGGGALDLLDAIGTARAGSDYVILCIRWGAKGEVFYDKEQEAVAVSCVEAGADAVIGGGPNRLQGVSFLDGVPVIYSLGSFGLSTGELYTAAAQLRINREGKLTLFMLPCIQKELSVRLLEDEEEKKEFYHYLADVSADVGMDEDGRVHPFHDVSGPGESPYAYTSGRRYGFRTGREDLAGRRIDGSGDIQQ